MATLSISSMSTLTGSVNNNSAVIPIVDLGTSTVSNQNKKIRISSQNQFYSNNNGVGGLSSYGNYFGTGVDGDLTISSSAQVSSSFNNTLDGDIFVKNYKNLTINVGVLVSPLKKCRGLIIYCTGNLTVTGTLSMNGKGGGVASKIASPIGVASRTDARYDLIDASIYLNNLSSSVGKGIFTHWNWAPSGSIWFNSYKLKVTLSGSVTGGTGGGISPTPNAAGTGTAGVFCCGGGGGGGRGQASPQDPGGPGGRGTIFAGGGGGGGSAYGNPAGGSGALSGGGSGGSNSTYGAGGGGAGAPAGAGGSNPTPGGSGTAGGDGSGGLLMIIVRGNITITGTVSSNGTTGGSGGTGYGYGGAGGGGSGGGCIVMIYGGTYSNSGTVTVNGGSGGAAGSPGGNAYAGGSGGAGVITIKKAHT